MTAPTRATAGVAEPFTVDAARRYVHDSALSDTPIGTVGLEVEAHLVDLGAVSAEVSWDRLAAAVQDASRRPQAGAVTVEPGGQIELSGPPERDLVTAIATMRRDTQRLRLGLEKHRLGLAYLGADPLRPPRRVNPRPRYRAMEHHFAATGRAAPAAAMMCSTAAVQVNLQAGPRPGWPARVALAHMLGPTLVAVAACSRWLAGRATGWTSARERAWAQLDPRISGPVPLTARPAEDWAGYALAAPVQFVRSVDGTVTAVTRPVPFGSWLSGQVRLDDRGPTIDDLRTHLTTLFPPVRMRGYLELRFLDVSSPRWWPAVVATTVTLMDDPVAADAAAEVTERAAGRWAEAARVGLRSPILAESARRCMSIAADRAPAELRSAVADLADLVHSGRCPGDLDAERIQAIGPRAMIEEAAHA